jgi:phosphate transport system substrate-binding protein
MKAAVGAAVLVAALAAMRAPALAAPAARPTITLGGAQVVESLVADLAYFYRHAVRDAPRFTLTAGGTGAGIADTARHITDGGLVTRVLDAADPPGLVFTRLARSGVCLVSNRANPVATLSHAQLQDLVAGRVTSWSGFAGSKRTDAVTPVALAATTGTNRVFASAFVDDGTPVAWRPVTLLTSAQARDYVEQTPGAFGYVDLALTAQLHVIAYEGVGCTRQTVRDGTYAAALPIGIVTRGRPRGALARFLRWARSSPTAQRVIGTRYVVG